MVFIKEPAAAENAAAAAAAAESTVLREAGGSLPVHREPRRVRGREGREGGKENKRESHCVCVERTKSDQNSRTNCNLLSRSESGCDL